MSLARLLPDTLLHPDRVAVMRALRGTLAALLALAVAALLGLDSPSWAAMTVWIVAQPTRGMLVGKGVARLAGTALGALVSVPLVQLAGVSHAGFAVAMALWIGACALLSSLLTGFRAYAALLAGYTALLVALVALHQPEQVAALAQDRVGCIAIGILASALVTWLWTPAGERGLLRQRAARTAQEAVRWMAVLLSGTGPASDLAALETRLVSDMAVLDAQCDLGASGAPAVRQEHRQVRHLLVALLGAMAAARALAEAAGPAGHVRSLAGPAPDLAALRTAVAAWREAAATTPPAGLRAHLETLDAALGAVAAGVQGLNAAPAPAGTRHAVVAHRDWPNAWRTGARTGLVLLGLGLAWAATGWPLLLMAMMGAAILCSIFATLEVPKTSIWLAVKGTSAGTAAAALFALGVLPWLHTLPALLLALVPFMLVGGLLLADRRTAAVGMDYSMVFLLLAAPALPVDADSAHFLRVLPGPLLGALAAAAAFHWVLPTDPLLRLRDLAAALVGDLRRLGAAPPPVPEAFWRARALHRGLRLVLRASAAGQDSGRAVRLALGAVNLGASLYALRRALSALPADEAPARATHELLADLACGTEPVAALAGRFTALAAQAGERPATAALGAPLRQAGAFLAGLPEVPATAGRGSRG